MTDSSADRVYEIFEAAREVAESSRTDFVERLCDGDAEMSREVLSLLSFDGNATDFLGCADAEPTPIAVEAGLPSRLGEFEILGKVGQGGMGIVYEAMQDSPRRRVALKVVQPYVLSEKLMARFQLEVELLGRLQHEGIAQIHAAGTFDLGDGRQPYLAMEFVEGTDLQTWARAATVGPRDKLELFARMCDAVHHAHQRGVVHRDLKPDNVLVGPHGKFKILDFGIARATDADVQLTTIHTDVGQLIGTLPYMSPEQAAGDSHELDARSDIYSLGVLLYELLLGELPYELDGKPIPEVVRIICEREPKRPSLSQPSMRGDLDTILLRSLEKDPARRFESAAALGAEVERFLRDEPILSRPPSTFYQVQKFVRRNKGLTAGLVTALLTLLIGFIVSTVLYLEATAANVAKTKEANKALAIRDFLLSDMLAAASPWRQGIGVRVADLLDVAAPRVDEKFSQFPETAAAVRHTIGSAYASLGHGKRALSMLRRAWEESRGLLGPTHIDAQRARYSLARELMATGGYDEAEGHVRALHDQGFPSVDDPRTKPATLRMMLGHLKAARGDASGIDDAGRILDEVTREYGEGDEVVSHMRTMHTEALLSNRRLAGAEKLARRQMELYAQREVPLDAGQIRAAGALANAIFFQGRYDEGRAAMQSLLSRARTAFGSDHLCTLVMLARYGTMLSDINDLERSAAVQEDCCARLSRRLGPRHSYTLQVKNNQAIVLRKQGKLAEAERLVREVLEARRETLGEEDAAVAQSLDVLGIIQRAQRKYDDALRTLLEADRIYTAAFGARHYATLDARFSLAAVYENLQKHDRAEAIYRALLDPTKQVYGASHPYVGELQHKLARVCMWLGRPAEAERSVRQALELRRRILPKWHWHPHDSEALLGIILVKTERQDEGETLLLSALAGYERVKRIERAVGGLVFSTLIELYESTGRDAKAAEMRAKLAAVRAKSRR